ncbi:uro-adherence factor A-like [Melanerpes formicivorus]|uniref:uro-adherence factor A-like n=1 Tax=Melanerpes formicivorus TaxID=211600 RepID=UPI00358F47A2
MAAIWKYKLRVGRVDIDEKTLENREKTASETGNESIPTHLPHTSILHPQIGAAENKESMEMAEKRTNERGDNNRQIRTKSDDTVQVSRKRKLDNNETPTEKKVKKLNTGNESIPIPGSHTPILHPGGEAPENKERIKMAEKRRTNQSDDAVKGSPKQKLENNEKTDEKIENTTSETGNESISALLSHTLILNPRGDTSDNEEIIKMSETKRTNERDDNDVNTLGHNFELENNEKPDEKSSNESTPNPPSNTFIFIKEEPELREMSEEKATSESSDDDDTTIANLPCELLNDKNTAEHGEITTSESDNEAIPKSLSHTPILSPGSGAAENKEVAEKMSPSESDEDALLISLTGELQNCKKTDKGRENTTSESDNESIPTSLSHTPILSPGCGEGENKEVAEKTSTSESDEEVGIPSHRWELPKPKKPAKQKEITTSESDNESIPTSLSQTPTLSPGCGAAENKEVAEKMSPSESDEDALLISLTWELQNYKKTDKEKENTTAESDNESIPTSLSHTPIPSPGSGAAENKEVAEKTSPSESDEDEIIVSHRWELPENKKPAKEKENTTAEMGNESIRTHLPHTSILHQQIGAAENKESMEMAEKRTNERGDNDRQMRTKQSDDTVQVSRKRKLDNNETPTEKKVQKLNAGKESIPPPVSHTPILSPGSGEAENKEMAEKKRTNEIDDNDVNTLGHNFELENNEKPDEKSSNEAIPNPPSNTFIFMKGEPQLREMSEEKATSESSDDDDMTIANLPCELLNNKNIAEQEKITTLESDNESIPPSLSHTPIPCPGSGAAENKEVAEKMSSTESDEDVILVRVTWELQNYKNPAKEKENTTAESDNESIPTSPSPTPILSPGCGAAENKEMAETTSTSESDEDVGIVSHRWELPRTKKPDKEKKSLHQRVIMSPSHHLFHILPYFPLEVEQQKTRR